MTKDRITRRDFSRRAAAAAAGLLVAGTAAAAEEPTVPARKPPETAAAADVVARIVEQCPGLPESDRKELESQVKGVMDLAKNLREQKVSDGAEPDFVFRAAPEAPHAR